MDRPPKSQSQPPQAPSPGTEGMNSSTMSKSAPESPDLASPTLGRRFGAAATAARAQWDVIKSSLATGGSVKNFAQPPAPGSVGTTSRKALLALQKKHSRKVMKATCRFYTLFLVSLLTIIALQANIFGAFSVRQSISDPLFEEEFLASDVSNHKKTFFDVGEEEEFWQWAYGPLTNALTATIVPPSNVVNSSSAEASGWIGRENKVIGPVRFRSARVAAQNCSSTNLLGDTWCSPAFSESTAATNLYGLESLPEGYLDFWSYDDVNVVPTASGLLDLDYGTGGFYRDVALTNATEFTASIDEIRAQGFIDTLTRAVSVVFMTYNPNTEMYTVVTALFEFPVGGRIWPYPKFQSTPSRLYNLELGTTWFRMLLELFFVLFVMYYIFWEVIEIRVEGLGLYLRSAWNALDMTNILLFLLSIGIHIRIVYLGAVVREDGITGTSYLSDIQTLVSLNEVQMNILSGNIFLSIIKVSKYTRYNRHVSLMWNTLGTAAPDLLWFVGLVAVVQVAFASTAHVLYGPHLFGYRSWDAAFSSVSRIMLGDFDYEAQRAVNRTLTPFFYTVFVVLVVLVVLNLFIAILNDAYSREKRINVAGVSHHVNRLFESVRKSANNTGRRVAHSRVFPKKLRTKLRVAKPRPSTSDMYRIVDAVRHDMAKQEEAALKRRQRMMRARSGEGGLSEVSSTSDEDESVSPPPPPPSLANAFGLAFTSPSGDKRVPSKDKPKVDPKIVRRVSNREITLSELSDHALKRGLAKEHEVNTLQSTLYKEHVRTVIREATGDYDEDEDLSDDDSAHVTHHGPHRADLSRTHPSFKTVSRTIAATITRPVLQPIASVAGAVNTVINAAKSPPQNEKGSTHSEPVPGKGPALASAGGSGSGGSAPPAHPPLHWTASLKKFIPNFPHKNDGSPASSTSNITHDVAPQTPHQSGATATSTTTSTVAAAGLDSTPGSGPHSSSGSRTDVTTDVLPPAHNLGAKDPPVGSSSRSGSITSVSAPTELTAYPVSRPPPLERGVSFASTTAVHSGTLFQVGGAGRSTSPVKNDSSGADVDEGDDLSSASTKKSDASETRSTGPHQLEAAAAATLASAAEAIKSSGRVRKPPLPDKTTPGAGARGHRRKSSLSDIASVQALLMSASTTTSVATTGPAASQELGTLDSGGSEVERATSPEREGTPELDVLREQVKAQGEVIESLRTSIIGLQSPPKSSGKKKKKKRRKSLTSDDPGLAAEGEGEGEGEGDVEGEGEGEAAAGSGGQGDAESEVVPEQTEEPRLQDPKT